MTESSVDPSKFQIIRMPNEEAQQKAGFVTRPKKSIPGTVSRHPKQGIPGTVRLPMIHKPKSTSQDADR